MQCAFCGIEFKPKRKTNKYCSVDCQHKAIRERPLFAHCKYCGELFPVSRDTKGIFCSVSCSSKYYGVIKGEQARKRKEQQRIDKANKKKEALQLKQEQYINEHTKLCLVCGIKFIARNVTQLCCSAECSKAHDNARRDKRIYKNGVPDLTISLTRLYMRDMGVCQLCGKHIDFDCDYNSDDYPSIDHTKPLARGGLHEWNNVQLACRGCNRIKSDK